MKRKALIVTGIIAMVFSIGSFASAAVSTNVKDTDSPVWEFLPNPGNSDATTFYNLQDVKMFKYEDSATKATCYVLLAPVSPYLGGAGANNNVSTSISCVK